MVRRFLGAAERARGAGVAEQAGAGRSSPLGDAPGRLLGDSFIRTTWDACLECRFLGATHHPPNLQLLGQESAPSGVPLLRDSKVHSSLRSADLHGRLSSACGFAPSWGEDLPPSPLLGAHWRFSGSVSQAAAEVGEGCQGTF